jgi:hypothetical protein
LKCTIVHSAVNAGSSSAPDGLAFGGIAQAAPTVTRWAVSEDTDPELRLAAIAALEGIAGTDCAEALLTLVGSPNAEVAARAAQALDERSSLVDDAEA